jgi:alpha-amylase/alpha-mannosidase (GH57 family)
MKGPHTGNITTYHRKNNREIGEPTQALCIHAHFYQPPREDPLTGLIPNEQGAAPYANWNERIHAECYRPNAELGNFEHISFNVGPTLFQWMQTYDPVTYHRIIAQDRDNLLRFGVGNAIAQPYNHTILPLATREDKITQVTWGIADFEHRFGRKPQGMWLPETAVDLETLEVLAEKGLEFTILAPWQAGEADLDPTMTYRVELPSGRGIGVFFYHAELSAGVSFDQRRTSNAYKFVYDDLIRKFDPHKTRNGRQQLLTIATDGELYGHHQIFRDWFLAYLVHGAADRGGLQLTTPARWLRKHPPERTVSIKEGSSWSCHHGVARWSDRCDCTPQSGDWKGHLRQAFDCLAGTLDDLYSGVLLSLGLHPWELRDRYVQVILGVLSAEDLITQFAMRQVPAAELIQVKLLLEAQYQRQRMYTSCGWFFEHFDRIEPQNNVAYAAQAVWLTRQAMGVDLAPQTISDLSKVASRRSGLRGDQVFKRHLQRCLVGDGRAAGICGKTGDRLG